jgi:hypothetical protein
MLAWSAFFFGSITLLALILHEYQAYYMNQKKSCTCNFQKAVAGVMHYPELTVVFLCCKSVLRNY